MKAVCKKLFSLMLVAILLVSAVPFQASAEEVNETVAAPVEAAAVETAAPAAEAEIVAEAPAAEAEIVEETPVVEGEIIADVPEAYAGVALDKDEVRVDFQLAEDSELGISTTYRVSRVKSKIGSTVSTPKGSSALSVLKKAIGSVDGIEFVRWYYLKDGEPTTFNSSVVLNRDNMSWEARDENEDGAEFDYVDVYAEFKTVATNITLKPNGGSVASTKFLVEVGKPYNEYGTLPVPTRSGYNFLGWYKADGTRVDVEEAPVVADLGSLTAKWSAGKYTVVYQGFTGEWEEVGFGSFAVDNKSVLKTEYNNFPTDAQIKAMFAYEGWKIDGWEYSADNGSTWNTFTAGKTKITSNTIIRPLYKKSITLYACDSGNTTRSLTVTLGKRFPTLPHPGTRDGLAFVGWYLSLDFDLEELVSSKENLSNTSKHLFVTEDVEALYAGWAEAKTVYLYIHTNGNTKEHTKLVKYYDVSAEGFDLTDINLADIFPNYGKYDDEGDEKWGWYDKAQWENYCLGRHKYDTTEFVTKDYLEGDDVHEFYIMLIDNGNNTTTNGTGYNDNKTTVDSSNPSTGDEIFVPVAIMAVSACAIVLFFLNKKRIVK